jgi:hypothetical protein
VKGVGGVVFTFAKSSHFSLLKELVLSHLSVTFVCVQGVLKPLVS